MKLIKILIYLFLLITNHSYNLHASQSTQLPQIKNLINQLNDATSKELSNDANPLIQNIKKVFNDFITNNKSVYTATEIQLLINAINNKIELLQKPTSTSDHVFQTTALVKLDAITKEIPFFPDSQDRPEITPETIETKGLISRIITKIPKSEEKPNTDETNTDSRNSSTITGRISSGIKAVGQFVSGTAKGISKLINFVRGQTTAEEDTLINATIGAIKFKRAIYNVLSKKEEYDSSIFDVIGTAFSGDRIPGLKKLLYAVAKNAETVKDVGIFVSTRIYSKKLFNQFAYSQEKSLQNRGTITQKESTTIDQEVALFKDKLQNSKIIDFCEGWLAGKWGFTSFDQIKVTGMRVGLWLVDKALSGLIKLRKLVTGDVFDPEQELQNALTEFAQDSFQNFCSYVSDITHRIGIPYTGTTVGDIYNITKNGLIKTYNGTKYIIKKGQKVGTYTVEATINGVKYTFEKGQQAADFTVKVGGNIIAGVQNTVSSIKNTTTSIVTEFANGFEALQSAVTTSGQRAASKLALITETTKLTVVKIQNLRMTTLTESFTNELKQKYSNYSEIIANGYTKLAKVFSPNLEDHLDPTESINLEELQQWIDYFTTETDQETESDTLLIDINNMLKTLITGLADRQVTSGSMEIIFNGLIQEFTDEMLREIGIYDFDKLPKNLQQKIIEAWNNAPIEAFHNYPFEYFDSISNKLLKETLVTRLLEFSADNYNKLSFDMLQFLSQQTNDQSTLQNITEAMSQKTNEFINTLNTITSKDSSFTSKELDTLIGSIPTIELLLDSSISRDLKETMSKSFMDALNSYIKMGNRGINNNANALPDALITLQEQYSSYFTNLTDDIINSINSDPVAINKLSIPELIEEYQNPNNTYNEDAIKSTLSKALETATTETLESIDINTVPTELQDSLFQNSNWTEVSSKTLLTIPIDAIESVIASNENTPILKENFEKAWTNASQNDLAPIADKINEIPEFLRNTIFNNQNWEYVPDTDLKKIPTAWINDFNKNAQAEIKNAQAEINNFVDPETVLDNKNDFNQEKNLSISELIQEYQNSDSGYPKVDIETTLLDKLKTATSADFVHFKTMTGLPENIQNAIKDTLLKIPATQYKNLSTNALIEITGEVNDTDQEQIDEIFKIRKESLSYTEDLKGPRIQNYNNENKNNPVKRNPEITFASTNRAGTAASEYSGIIITTENISEMLNKAEAINPATTIKNLEKILFQVKSRSPENQRPELFYVIGETALSQTYTSDQSNLINNKFITIYKTTIQLAPQQFIQSAQSSDQLKTIINVLSDTPNYPQNIIQSAQSFDQLQTVVDILSHEPNYTEAIQTALSNQAKTIYQNNQVDLTAETSSTLFKNFTDIITTIYNPLPTEKPNAGYFEGKTLDTQIINILNNVRDQENTNPDKYEKAAQELAGIFIEKGLIIFKDGARIYAGKGNINQYINQYINTEPELQQKLLTVLEDKRPLTSIQNQKMIDSLTKALNDGAAQVGPDKSLLTQMKDTIVSSFTKTWNTITQTINQLKQKISPKQNDYPAGDNPFSNTTSTPRNRPTEDGRFANTPTTLTPEEKAQQQADLLQKAEAVQTVSNQRASNHNRAQSTNSSSSRNIGTIKDAPSNQTNHQDTLDLEHEAEITGKTGQNDDDSGYSEGEQSTDAY